MPDIKKPVKEVAVYDGSSWDRYDIGAKAENVSLSNIGIGNNVNSAFSTLIGPNTLTDNKIVITDNQQHIKTSDVNSSLLGSLSDTTIIENQGTLDNNVIIKKLKQNGTNNIICPESKTSAIYMSDNETTLDNYLGTITSAIDDITNTIGDTDISSIGNGTITGAIDELNSKFSPQIISNTKNNIRVTRGNNSVVASVTLPANGKYLCLGRSSLGTGGELRTGNNWAITSGTPKFQQLNNFSSMLMDSGQHKVTWAYVETNAACVLALREYGYTSTTITNASGTIIAIPLLNA